MHATASGRPADGARVLRHGLRLLGWREPAPAAPGGAAPVVADEHESTNGEPATPGLAARLLISLAYAEAEQGRTRYGFGLLDTAAELVDEPERGILVQQRGLMLLRVGRRHEALAELDAAVPLLDRGGHRAVLARTLLNRATLHFSGGRIAPGRADLDRCARLAAEDGNELLHAKAIQLRGWAEMLSGDIPAALASFAIAQERYEVHAPDYVPMVRASRARALLSVGMAGEAGRELDEAIAAFARQRQSQEQAEAELMRAHAALAGGDAEGAAKWADRARHSFRRRGNQTWAALAALMRLRAEAAGRRIPTGFLFRAGTLAAELRKLGLSDDAEMAELLRLRGQVAGGLARPARARLDRFGPGRRVGWLETALTRRLTHAEIYAATGDRRRALREIREGLATLHAYRSRLGSIDLQVAVAALGRELSATGLAAALDGGSARTILAWSERARAQAFRVLPVHAELPPASAADLAELRQLRHLMRTATLAGGREPGAAARCAELERRLREQHWERAGSGRDSPAPPLHALDAALAERGAVLVSFVEHGDRLSALVAAAGTVRLVPLGDLRGVTEPVLRLRADLDALAGRALPERLADAVRGSITSQVAALSARLMAPIRRLLGEGELIVVPTHMLGALPWAMLPELRGRPVVVAPSAAAWLAARARHAPAGDAAPAGAGAGGRRPLLVAGPDLRYADAELDAIAACHPTGRVLRGAEATVAATLAAFETAPVAHLAGHGHHETENVLFSRLDLADGPLMAYDVQHLAAVPSLITLSACDVGRAVVKPGDELLGFTAALLYAGGGSIIASVARVANDTAARLMVAFHRSVAGGHPPAEALAIAAAGEPVTPFVCFGAG